MLPVVASAATTRWQMLFYAVLMAAAAVAPWPLGLAGATYGLIATLTSLVFVGLTAWVVVQRAETTPAMKAERVLFVYSIGYILAIFATLAFDRLTA